MKQISLILMLILSISGCKTQQKSSENTNTDHSATQIAPKPFVAALPHVVIYKTTKNYSQNVPVILLKDKMQIVSYPHPSDLYYNGKFALPEVLHNGYLLDNRGINKNVAFLKYTYKEYSKFTDAPTLDELFKNIIDKEPLIELWDCGKQANFTDLQKQLNEMIDKNQLIEKCKRVK